MNPTSCQSQTASACCGSSAAGDANASCRLPLAVLFPAASFWLIVSSVLGILASIKFHAPDFLSDCASMNYGRLHASAGLAFLYGFAIQAGYGVGIWILASLGRNAIARPLMIALGGKLWNLGVLLGVVSVLLGGSTGFDNLEMPHHAGWCLWLGMLVMGYWSVKTLHQRTEKSLQPSQWFLLAATFWLPWIFSTARLLLIWWPVRGVTQSVLVWWFTANLNLVWMGLVGLAAAFHFMPVLMNKPLHSRQMAFFTFWTVILFASWSGIPSGAPLPAWIPVISGIATVLTIVPVLAVALNVYRTCGSGCSQTENTPAGKFIAFGLMAFVVAWTMNVFAALPAISAITSFTWFTVAQSQLNAYGFFAMTMFGGIYYIVPRVVGVAWPCERSVRAHYWLAAIGVLLIVAPLAIGGIRQGLALSHPQVAFLDTAKATLPFLRVSTMGELFIAVGHLLLAVNVARLLCGRFKAGLLPALAAATAELKPAGVKS
ncbi:MAG: cbb3-type cytochrome c oxidase subunit I [Verrucomicrobiota bacterium]